jgi:hypothetical protein
MIRPIETVYKGYRFRSRLEARWAVFFDTLGLPWEYEPEGFELPAGRYLPDFKVRYPGRDASEVHFVWFEVKGDVREVTDEQWARMIEFGHTVGDLIMLDGTPDMRMYQTPYAMCNAEGADWTKDAPPHSSPWLDSKFCDYKARGFAVRPYKAQAHTFEHDRAGVALWCGKGRLWWDYREDFFTGDRRCEFGEGPLPRAVDAARSARFEFGESGAIHPA